MIIYVYTYNTYNKTNSDILFLKKNNTIYSLTTSANINELIHIKNDTIVYFGGHEVLYYLYDFGLNNNIKTIDLKQYFWNKNTNLTNLSLTDCCSTYLKDSCNIKENDITNSIYNLKLKNYILLEEMIITNTQTLELQQNVNICFNEINYIFSLLENMFLLIKNDNNIFANDIDTMLSKSLIKLEQTTTTLDNKYLSKLKNDVNKELNDILESIYFLTKKKFNINSQRELNYVLKEIGVLNNKVSKIELNNNFEQTGLLLFKYIDQFRKLTIFYEQYIKPLYTASLKNGYGRFKYNECRVPCLTKNHFCIEKTKGIIDISEIECNDYIWTEYGFKRVIRADKHITNELTRIELSNGLSITGTNHHPILVNKRTENTLTNTHSIQREWCSLENVFVGEKIITPFNYIPIRELQSNVVKNIAFIICNILNNYIVFNKQETNYLTIKNVRFSPTFTFEKFKSSCELLGLKNISICKNNLYNVYDILIFNIDGLNNLLKKYSNLLTQDVIRQINLILKNKKYTESVNKKELGYFQNDYEETIITKVIKLNKEDIVYDIEVEDVHQYNANCTINHNTGRLSSLKASKDNNLFTNINIQSVPKHFIENVNIRKSFTVDKDCLWCCIDYKSQELRLVSNLYNINFIKNIPLSEDIYTIIENNFRIFDNSNLNKTKRRDAVKIICLGMIYGLTNFGINSQLKSLDVDNNNIDFRKEFFNMFPELEIGQTKTLKYAHAINGIYTLSGRFRSINFTNFDKENFFTRNNRIALNTVIQGSCGDIMRTVINNIENNLSPIYNKYGFKLLNTIHDEINFSIPNDTLLFNEILSHIIKIIKTPFKNNISFGYTISIGNNWGELRELKDYNYL